MDWNRISFADQHLDDFPADGGRDGDGRLVGFHFDDVLSLLDQVTDIHKDFQYVTRFDAVTKIR